LIIYFSELALAPLALVQSLNLCFMAGKAAQLATFALAGGHLSPPVLLASVILSVLAGLCLLAGGRVRQRLAAETYRQWLRYVLFVMALVLIVQFIFEIR